MVFSGLQLLCLVWQLISAFEREMGMDASEGAAYPAGAAWRRRRLGMVGTAPKRAQPSFPTSASACAGVMQCRLPYATVYNSSWFRQRCAGTNIYA